jgi:ATP-dependent helicase IRC3
MSSIAEMTHLRDYQRESLEAICSAFERGVWSQIGVLPTGAGKTVVFAHVRQAMQRWIDNFPTTQQKTLVLAHRDTLLEQAASKIAHYNPDLRIDIEQGGRRAAPMADVVIASIPSLTAMGGRRLQAMDPDDYRAVIVDEAHHSPARTYQDVLRHFGLVPPAEITHCPTPAAAAQVRTRVREWWANTWPNRLLLGVTATPNRADAIGLEWTFREITFERSLRWMIDRGYLSPLTGVIVDTDVNLDHVRKVAGDFHQGQLAEIVNTDVRNRLAVDAWKQHAQDRLTIAFCVDVKHARDLAKAFKEAGVSAESVAGEDPDRDDVITAFRRGDFDVLTNCNLLTEGVDIPEVRCILHCKPTASQAAYMQMTGRGTRLAPGKTDCLVMDIADVAQRHSLVTVGDLFGLPRHFNAKGADLNAQAQLVDRLREDHPDMPLLPGMTPESLHASVRQIDLWAVKDSETVQRHAKLQWMEDTPERFHVALPARADDGALRSGEASSRVEISLHMLGGWRVSVSGSMAEELGMLDDLAMAFDRAERWIEHTRPDAWRMKRRDAGWRQQPASEKQIQLLRKLRAPITANLTRGMASDMLDRHFGRKRD